MVFSCQYDQMFQSVLDQNYKLVIHLLDLGYLGKYSNWLWAGQLEFLAKTDFSVLCNSMAVSDEHPATIVYYFPGVKMVECEADHSC